MVGSTCSNGPHCLRAIGFAYAYKSEAQHGRTDRTAAVALQTDARGMQVVPLTHGIFFFIEPRLSTSARTSGRAFLPGFPRRSWQSRLPVEKCSAKTTVSGVATNPDRVHSGVSLGQGTERERLFHQNMTGMSRHRGMDSPSLGFVRRGDRSNARTEVQELDFRQFRPVPRDVNILALLTRGRWLCCALGTFVSQRARNAQ